MMYHTWSGIMSEEGIMEKVSVVLWLGGVDCYGTTFCAVSLPGTPPLIKEVYITDIPVCFRPFSLPQARFTLLSYSFVSFLL